ncbi:MULTISPECIES: twin transmembrane helix small protein [Caldimonas]|uniref:twin transmembrane helix small protein n=1 Tax=Caldimonas TaxID=196013 RepID=UPI000378C432|nr:MULTISPECIES: twin transmembrane helix small protein [Caldimonas]MCX7660165.1 twin transmembrane helix small protein [Caldimonas manganoxidans]
MKVFIVVAFVLILASLASALVFMMRDGRDGKPKTNNMVRSLSLRVGLSIALFLCILLAYQLGWIQPTGVPLVK